MALPVEPEELTRRRRTFFKLAFGTDAEGWITIGYLNKQEGWREHYFHYPSQEQAMLDHIQRNYKTSNVYFCPQLIIDPKFRKDGKGPRVKENIGLCTNAWADLDKCAPDVLLVKPSLVVESSPGRYQALWVFEYPIPAEDAQQISRNIAYHHVPDGCDRGGWDLTQMLRVPYTYNMKYGTLKEVDMIRATRQPISLETFKVYKESRINAATSDPMPEMLPTEAPLDLLQRYRRSMNPIIFSLFSIEPPADGEGGWSKALWQLQMLCFEAGLSREEVFYIASESACNKYRRDNRNPRLLWEEVCRAYVTSVEKLNVLVPETVALQPIISEAELERIKDYETFIERYIKWASSLGDAAKQYHQASAFMALSSILAGSVRLPTSFGTVMPNLWFMLLADTTLTRKSTAMDIGNDLVEIVDPDVLLATDGSLEGLMQSLEVRPGRPSLFLRDEISGLIEAMAKKDYMAGMAEALTKLYDGKTMKRVLKRETVTIREPCLLFFAGGIKTRVQSLLTLDHVASGFIPRFIFITAESDVSKLKPLGPPTLEKLEERDMLVDELRRIRERYVRTIEIIVKGQITGISEERTEAYLTSDAWDRYNQLEATLLYAGVNSDQPDIMTPVYDRLAKSILKAAVLVAASNVKDDDGIEVTLDDLLLAIKYGQGWKAYGEDIVNGIGRSANEVLLQRVYKSIARHPGVARSRLMQWYHLEARQAEIIFATLEQRGLITASRLGKTWVYEILGRVQIKDDDKSVK